MPKPEVWINLRILVRVIPEVTLIDISVFSLWTNEGRKISQGGYLCIILRRNFHGECSLYILRSILVVYFASGSYKTDLVPFWRSHAINANQHHHSPVRQALPLSLYRLRLYPQGRILQVKIKRTRKQVRMRVLNRLNEKDSVVCRHIYLPDST